MVFYQVGKRLGKDRYDIVALVFEDDEVNVYRVIDQHQVKPCIIKVMRPQTLSDALVKQFEEECQLLMLTPTSPGFIHVEDYFIEDQSLFVVQEDISAPLLRDFLINTQLTPEGVVKLMKDLVQLVRKMYTHEFIHRQVSIDKVFVTQGGIKLGGLSFTKTIERMQDRVLNAQTTHLSCSDVRQTLLAVLTAFGRQDDHDYARPAHEVGLSKIDHLINRQRLEAFLNKPSTSDMAIRIMSQADMDALFQNIEKTHVKKPFKLNKAMASAVAALVLVTSFAFLTTGPIVERLTQNDGFQMAKLGDEMVIDELEVPLGSLDGSGLADALPDMIVLMPNNRIYDLKDKKMISWEGLQKDALVFLSMMNIVTGNTYYATISEPLTHFDLNTLNLVQGYYEARLHYEVGELKSQDFVFSFGIRDEDQ